MVKSSRFRFFSLAAWNWRLYRRGAAVLLGAATLLEAGLLFGCAGNLNLRPPAMTRCSAQAGRGSCLPLCWGLRWWLRRRRFWRRRPAKLVLLTQY